MNLQPLVDWFQLNARILPWRENTTPYRVWISEVMLQQTQATVVIPYFEKWMKLFPTFTSLATADEKEVLKAWEGLGYYSRARRLQQTAKELIRKGLNTLPNTFKELSELPGLGPYTIGAILSFAFKEKAAAVDGNVIRLLTRLLALSDDVSKNSTIKKLQQITLELLPDHEPWVAMEALIELGATVCQKKPTCHICPLSSSCKVFSMGNAQSFPVKSAKSTCTHLVRHVAVIHSGKRFLVQRGKAGKVMEGLLEFPYLELEAEPSTETLTQKWQEALQLSLKPYIYLEEVKHSFTRYQVKLKPVIFTTVDEKLVEDKEWLSREELERLAFSSGHKRILKQLHEFFDNSTH